MVPKNVLRTTLQEVLEEHKLEKNKDLLDDLTDAIGGVVEVFDDEESTPEDDEDGAVLGG